MNAYFYVFSITLFWRFYPAMISDTVIHVAGGSNLFPTCYFQLVDLHREFQGKFPHIFAAEHLVPLWLQSPVLFHIWYALRGFLPERERFFYDQYKNLNQFECIFLPMASANQAPKRSEFFCLCLFNVRYLNMYVIVVCFLFSSMRTWMRGKINFTAEN